MGYVASARGSPILILSVENGIGLAEEDILFEGGSELACTRRGGDGEVV